MDPYQNPSSKHCKNFNQKFSSFVSSPSFWLQMLQLVAVAAANCFRDLRSCGAVSETLLGTVTWQHAASGVASLRLRWQTGMPPQGSAEVRMSS